MSVCVINHDYGRFLDDAIESALAQAGAEVEVLVVDDGSTDDSRERLARWKGRVRVIEQENLGHAGAVNRAFTEARGRYVMFLDADDTLLPGAVAAAAAAFDADPTLSRVQFRMQVTDVALRPIGITPARSRMLPSGDLGAHVLRHRNYAWSPGSANVYDRERLRAVMPIDEEAYRKSPDVYMAELTPLLGRICSIDEPLVRYRMHGSNEFFGHAVDLGWLQEKIRLTVLGHENLVALALSLGREPMRDPLAPPDVAFLGYRLASLLLDTEAHPIAGDGRRRLALDGIRASLRHPHLSPADRTRRGVWFALAGLLPRAAASRMVSLWVPDTHARPRLWLAHATRAALARLLARP